MTPHYAHSAYRAEAIPPLPAPGPKHRRERSIDELQPFGDYAGVDPYTRVSDDAATVQEQDRQDAQFYEKGWWWDHQRIRFLNEKLGLMALLMVVPYLWGLILIPGGALAVMLSIGPYFSDLPVFLIFIIIMVVFCSWSAFGFYIYGKTTTWIMNGIAWLLKPFDKRIEKGLDESLEKGSSEFNRQTGMVTFARSRKSAFEAPFIEFDAYVERVVQRGGIFYKLTFTHRYTGEIFNKLWLDATTHDRTEVYAFWDMLQRYMDVSQPLPDVPRLEPFRERDPITAEHDRQTGRDPRYWRDLDLDAWKQGAGAELHQAQHAYPWQQRRCRLTQQLGKVALEAYTCAKAAQGSVA
nr:hypothetical protein [uncultured Halomonas sp.]